MNTRLIILDRDGVINHLRARGVASPEEWEALPGSMEAIAQLCRANYRVVIATNQSGIARGAYTINTLNRIHQKMLDELQPTGGEIDAIFFCPHDTAGDGGDGCECRKPKPGMFLELAERLQCDLHAAHAVGDSLRDLQAASSAGAKPVLVQTGNGRQTEGELAKARESGLKDIPVYADLAAFVQALLATESAPAELP